MVVCMAVATSFGMYSLVRSQRLRLYAVSAHSFQSPVVVLDPISPKPFSLRSLPLASLSHPIGPFSCPFPQHREFAAFVLKINNPVLVEPCNDDCMYAQFCLSYTRATQSRFHFLTCD